MPLSLGFIGPNLPTKAAPANPARCGTPLTLGSFGSMNGEHTLHGVPSEPIIDSQLSYCYQRSSPISRQPRPHRPCRINQRSQVQPSRPLRSQANPFARVPFR